MKALAFPSVWVSKIPMVRCNNLIKCNEVIVVLGRKDAQCENITQPCPMFASQGCLTIINELGHLTSVRAGALDDFVEP